MAMEDDSKDRRSRHRAPATRNTNATNGAPFTEYQSLFVKEMENLKDRLNALEVMGESGGRATCDDAGNDDEDKIENRRRTKQNQIPTSMTTMDAVATDAAKSSARTIQWNDNTVEMHTSPDDENDSGSKNNYESNNKDYERKPPPMRKIKFSSLPSLPPPENVSNVATVHTAVPRNHAANNDDDDADSNKNVYTGSVHSSSSSTTTSSSSIVEGGTVAFSGWARVFFQARHHHSATLLTPFGGLTPWSQDTYLYISIIQYTTDNNTTDGLNLASLKKRNSNELHICAAAISKHYEASTSDNLKNNNYNHAQPQSQRPKLLIDPPIVLKYFYALKVPGSRSGAALFLRNDDRRLRKYIFRFEVRSKCFISLSFVNITQLQLAPQYHLVSL
jgi:hypothetical protein